MASPFVAPSQRATGDEQRRVLRSRKWRHGRNCESGVTVGVERPQDACAGTEEDAYDAAERRSVASIAAAASASGPTAKRLPSGGSRSDCNGAEYDTGNTANPLSVDGIAHRRAVLCSVRNILKHVGRAGDAVNAAGRGSPCGYNNGYSNAGNMDWCTQIAADVARVVEHRCRNPHGEMNAL